MKNKSFTLSKVATATGFLLGAFALSVLAATWTPPECDPPGCNTDAPLNVGTDYQIKKGPISLTGLSLGKEDAPFGTAKLDIEGTAITTGLVVNGLTYTDSLQVGGTDASRQNYVLTNDGTGVALWKPIGSLIEEITPGSGSVEYFEIDVPRPGKNPRATSGSNNASVTNETRSLTNEDGQVYPVSVRKLTTTSTSFKFCALSRIGDDFANSDRSGSFCQVKKNANGTWELSGGRGDDPSFFCGMYCMQ